MTLARPEVVALEQLAARAWPAARDSRIGGWNLYASSGFSGRINACWPLEDPGEPLATAVARTEAWYQDQGLPCVFKLIDGAGQPEALAHWLAGLGYGPHTETLMMVGPAGGLVDPAVRLAPYLDEPFAAVFAATAPDPGDARERLETLARVPTPRAFARLDVAGEAAAIGAGAVEGEWAGVFAMRTDARYRRQGLARRVLTSLLANSSREGASRVWLQVEADNDAAIALYAAAGFAEVYRYRYWRR
jgi:ribosomal protein S18 acetylase RimI-like enzyme